MPSVRLELDFRSLRRAGIRFEVFFRAEAHEAADEVRRKLTQARVEKLRRSIYQAKQMRVRRNPDILSYKETFENWKTDAARWKKDIKKGRRTSEEFIQWLNDCKRKS